MFNSDVSELKSNLEDIPKQNADISALLQQCFNELRAAHQKSIHAQQMLFHAEQHSQSVQELSGALAAVQSACCEFDRVQEQLNALINDRNKILAGNEVTLAAALQQQQSAATGFGAQASNNIEGRALVSSKQTRPREDVIGKAKDDK